MTPNPSPDKPKDEMVERVARACANDQAARSIANKGGTVEFDAMDDETQDFWRCIARAAIEASQLAGGVGERERLREALESARRSLKVCLAIAPKPLREAIYLNGYSAYEVTEAAIGNIDAALSNNPGGSDG